MKNVRGFAILILSVILSAIAYAVPGSLTYQGRIKNTDGLALEYNGVKFEFSILNPTGTCTIYKETSLAIDMRNSGGVFDVPIGTGSKVFPTSPSFKLLDSFDNSMAFNCENGDTYTPLVDDKRFLRVQFHDGLGWRLISPDSEIRAVPYAGQAKVAQSAQKLGNNTAADFILKSNVPLCGAGQYLRHIAPLGTFECTAPTVMGSNVTGNITGSSAGFTGNLLGDVTGTQSATSVDKIKGITLNMTGLAPGKVLKYNGTSWAPADDDGTTGALTGLTGDVTSTGSPTATVTLNKNSVSTNKIVDGAITSAKIADGTIVDADISGSANITDTKLAMIATAGKVSGSAITSGTISGSASINTSGTVTSSSVSASTLSTNSLQIYKTGNGNKVTITVPTSLSPDYSLQLPGDAGNPGQILSTNGSGVLSWIDSASGSLTSVTATAPLASTGGSTPQISLNDSGVTNGTYTKVTVSAKGLVTAGEALISSDIPNLSGDVTSTSGTSNTKVEKIQGVTVATTTPLTGQVLIYGGANWAPQYFGMGQLRSTVTGTTQVPASCSTADKTLTWSAITDSFACTTIAIANTQVTGLGTASTKNFGTAPGNLVELDGAGKIPTSLLPSSAGNILDGGNSTGATVSIGTNDANSLAFKTNSTTKMTLTSSGNVGIGTSTPQSGFTLDVNGAILNRNNTLVHGVNTAAPSGGRVWQSVINTVDGGYYLGVRTDDTPTAGSVSTAPLKIFPNASTDSLVLNGGNVGIGTTNPQAKLHVNGIIRATDICDENGANCKNISSGWGSGGSVTNVATGTGLTGGPITGSGTISIAAGGVSATELASNAVTTVKIADGNVTGAKLETLAGLVGATYGSATSVPAVTVDTKGRITAITTNNITGLLPAASGANGKYLKSDGTSWSGQDVKFSDIKNSVGATAFNTSSCAANQTVKWSSLTDMFECQNIGSLDAATITTGIINSSRLPAGASMWQDGGAGKIYYNSGNVGIGATSPQSLLHLRSPSGTAAKLTMDRANDNDQNYLVFQSAASLSASSPMWMIGHPGSTYDLNVSTWDGSTSKYPFSIKANGNIGVGTTSPAGRMEIVNTTGGSTNSNYLQITGSTADNANYPGISLKGGNLATSYPNISVTNAGYGLYLGGGASGIVPNAAGMSFDSVNGISLSFGGSPKMNILTNGNVGIGTVNPGATLEVVGTVKILGTRTTGLSVGTVYQAATDGFVYAGCFASTGSQANMYLAVDVSNPPTALLAQAFCATDAGGNYQSTCTFTFPVKKGEYYKITTSNISNCNSNISFTPMGR